MPRLQQIEVGFKVFASEGGEGFGAIQAVEPNGRPEMTVYIENHGTFDVPYLVIESVHDQKVIVDLAKLPQPMRLAIEHAHDQERR